MNEAVVQKLRAYFKRHARMSFTGAEAWTVIQTAMQSLSGKEHKTPEQHENGYAFPCPDPECKGYLRVRARNLYSKKQRHIRRRLICNVCGITRRSEERLEDDNE